MSRPRQHTVLPKSQLEGYFPDNQGFAVYDIQTGKWGRQGPKTFRALKGYYDDADEGELSKIESAGIAPIRKLAKLETLNDNDRRHVAEYVIASLFRNSSRIERLLVESIEDVKGSLPGELSRAGSSFSEGHVIEKIDAYVNDESNLQKLRGDSAIRSKLRPEFVERVYNLCWHIIHVKHPPTMFLLTDFPFRYSRLDSDEAAWLGFPVSSEVLLYMNNYPGKDWLTYPMERRDVIDYGRNLVEIAERFVAVPHEDPKITKMIQRIRPVGSRSST